MALQIEVTGPVITSAGEMYRNGLVNSEFTLKCWNEGDDPKTDTPVIDRKFSYQQKTEKGVSGKTTDELAKRVEDQATADMKKAIADYENNYEKILEADSRVQQMASNIQGAING